MFDHVLWLGNPQHLAEGLGPPTNWKSLVLGDKAIQLLAGAAFDLPHAFATEVE